uniref:Retrotransposon gag domain-containing protein n=1 Tax=Anopheles minimus TaxID=112268 RepID=A0A182VT27_9DIPT
MATLDPASMASLAAMIAEALRTATGASEQARQGTKPAAPRFTHPAFQSNEGTACDYFNRMEWALQLHGIAEAKYAEYARVYMGAELNNALKFLIAPRLPETILYKELRQTLETHFDKKRNKFVECIKFQQIKQNKDETIAQYTLRLKQGAAHCEYGNFLDRMLIKQLLHGLTERDICDEIIAKNPDTFKDACDIATTLEATHHTALEVNTSTKPAESTNKLGYEPPKTKKSQPLPANQRANRSSGHPSSKGSQQQNRNADPNSCNGCGGPHLRSHCRFRDARCNKCNKKGHIAKLRTTRYHHVATRTCYTEHDAHGNNDYSNLTRSMDTRFRSAIAASQPTSQRTSRRQQPASQPARSAKRSSKPAQRNAAASQPAKRHVFHRLNSVHRPTTRLRSNGHPTTDATTYNPLTQQLTSGDRCDDLQPAYAAANIRRPM